MSEESTVVELEPELEKLAGQLDELTLLQASKLVKHLEDPDAAMACIEALARIGDKRATAPIARSLSLPQAEIRLEAVEAD